MDVLTKIILIIFGTGFLGNLILYWVKKRDSVNSIDKELLNSVIDEICNLCYSIDTIIDKNENVSKKLNELHKKQVKLLNEADSKMKQFLLLQDKLRSYYDKGNISKSDSISIDFIKKEEDKYLKERNLIMDEALSIPKERKNCLADLNLKIQKELSSYSKLKHRLSNTYKFSNKNKTKIISEQLKKIDNSINDIIKWCESHPTVQLPQLILFKLYKDAINCRLKITELN